MAESAFSRRLDDLSHSIVSVSEHMQLPREVVDEIETLEENFMVLGAALEVVQVETAESHKINHRRALDAELLEMQKSIEDSQVQLQECQDCASMAATRELRNRELCDFSRHCEKQIGNSAEFPSW